MRLIHYTVFNKTTNKRVFTSAYLKDCERKINTFKDKENYEIRHKWISI